jgi:glycerophosphoryl diester phosphodiesterase
MTRSLIAAFYLCAAIAAGAQEHIDRAPRQGGVYVVAHRGAHEGIPENTLAAYRKAIELGCDYVEIDTRATKDGHIVSVHNEDVDSYTKDAKGEVKNFTLAELKALDIGSRISPSFATERIPTFEEILAVCKGKIGIYLDLKEAPVAQLVQLVQAQGMEREVLWYATAEELAELRALCPTCIPMPDPGPEANLAPLLETFKPGVVASVAKFLSEAFVQACHGAGAVVIVDESRDPEPFWAQAVAWDVDGIQTDHPERLIAWLKAREGQR